MKKKYDRIRKAKTMRASVQAPDVCFVLFSLNVVLSVSEQFKLGNFYTVWYIDSDSNSGTGNAARIEPKATLSCTRRTVLRR